MPFPSQNSIWVAKLWVFAIGRFWESPSFFILAVFDASTPIIDEYLPEKRRVKDRIAWSHPISVIATWFSSHTGRSRKWSRCCFIFPVQASAENTLSIHSSSCAMSSLSVDVLFVLVVVTQDQIFVFLWDKMDNAATEQISPSQISSREWANIALACHLAILNVLFLLMNEATRLNNLCYASTPSSSITVAEHVTQ